MQALGLVTIKKKWKAVNRNFCSKKGEVAYLGHDACCNVQGVPKGTDTFQSFIIRKLDNLRKKNSYHESQYQVPFF